MNYWLIKSEEEAYSIDDLKLDKTTLWEGVRNYASRNFMMKMEVGDLCLFYHSGSNAGVYGIAKVVKKAHADKTQFDTKGMHFEPKATKDKPIWYCVDVAFAEKLKNPVSRDDIKLDPKLAGMVVLMHPRLSIQPVSETHFRHITTI